MKIIEVACKKCKAVYETLETVPTENLTCPGCGNKDLEFTKTDREFQGCSGSCGSCTSCEE